MQMLEATEALPQPDYVERSEGNLQEEPTETGKPCAS